MISMHKLPFAVITATILAGCASAPDNTINTYSYDSQQHSGTVHVTEKVVHSAKHQCDGDWRSGPIYAPKGLPPALENGAKLQIDTYSADQGAGVLTVRFPMSLGEKVMAKDFQESRSYMLAADSNGLIMQGEHFYYPDGYFVRVSRPEIKGNLVKACIGIDRMYVLKEDLESSVNPPIYLDRLVVAYAMKDGEPVKVEFGSQIRNSAEIRVNPR